MGMRRQRRGVTVVQLVSAIAVTFLVHMLGMFSTAIAPIAWISPFSYFNPIATTIRAESCVADVVTLCCVFGVCTGMALVRFDRRDIQAELPGRPLSPRAGGRPSTRQPCYVPAP